jgi:type 2 lantibiotic biosynthesis protein LanM
MAGAAHLTRNARDAVEAAVAAILAGSRGLVDLIGAPEGPRAAAGDDLWKLWRAELGARGLRRRLDWAASRPEEGPPTRAPGDDLERRWPRLLAAALARLRVEGTPPYIDADAPIPFQELLVPFVEAARMELAREAGEALPLLSGAAQAHLERFLLGLLSDFALPVLHSEFALHRSLYGLPAWAGTGRSTRSYDAFVAEMAAGGLVAVLQEYPALARLLAGWCCGWARAHGQLARRLLRDDAAICAKFGLDAGRSRIEAITPYLSDPHAGGSAVARLELSDGTVLFYKPRSLAMEEGLGDILAWANRVGFSARYRPVRLLDCGDHGWMEGVEPGPCDSLAGIDSYYRRTGGLVCLVALLQGTDIHHENLVAAGDQPVIVDAETLLQPRLRPEAVRALGPGANRSDQAGDLIRALAESGFFPTGHMLDFSALGTAATVVTPFVVPRAVRVNTDAMAVLPEPYRASQRDNMPSLRGQPADGFAEMFRLALRHRDALAALLRGFAGRSVRLIARPTNVYGLLLLAARQPAALRCGARRSLVFERLRGAAVGEGTRPACWAILDAEAESLERMDVPHLVWPCDEDHPCWSAPLAQAAARVEQISQSDLETCVAWLEHALSRRPAEAQARLVEERPAGRCVPGAMGG